MGERTLTWGETPSNWYATFDNSTTIVALIPRKIERTAGAMAQAYADRFHAASVTLRKIHPRTKT